MPSRKTAYDGRTQFAPTISLPLKGRWIFAKQKDGGIPNAGLRRTAKDVGPYIVSAGSIVGKAFMPSAKSAYGGRTQFAPTVVLCCFL